MEDNKTEKLYDARYAQTEKLFGDEGIASDPFLVELIQRIPNGTILDLGAGQGRIAIPLARAGLHVTGRELSSVAVEQMHARAVEENLPLKAETGDARDLGESCYDAITSSFMFHLIPRDEAIAIIQSMKEHTSSNGYNHIATVTSDGDFFRNNSKTNNFYPTEAELRACYADWDIIKFELRDSVATQTYTDGTPMKNISAHLLAQKPLKED